MKTTLFNKEFQVEIKDFDTYYMIALKCDDLTINVEFDYEFNKITRCYDVGVCVHSEEIKNIVSIGHDDSSVLREILNEELAQNNHIRELIELVEEKFDENTSEESNAEDEFKVFYKSMQQVFYTAKLFN